MQAHSSLVAFSAYTILLAVGMVGFVWPQQVSRTVINFISRPLRPWVLWLNESGCKYETAKTPLLRLRYSLALGLALVFSAPLIQLMAMLYPPMLRFLGAILTLFSAYHLWQLAHLP
jgi:hypothetical protein